MYWWVNHKQTHNEEIKGGYIWSPKKNNNGARNQSYDNMKRTRVGDIIFSFANAKIQAIGEVVEPCSSAQKPADFGEKGNYWSDEGWLVKIEWHKLESPFRPKDHIEKIKSFLPEKYSPIQKSGNGNQGCYLAEIGKDLSDHLIRLANIKYAPSDTPLSRSLDNQISEGNENLDEITETDQVREVIVRKVQGKYRKNLEHIESCCRVTGLADKSFLIASHAKPWVKSIHKEKIDGNNGLLLSPHIDKLFDKGWVSFRQDGEMLVKEQRVLKVLEIWGIEYPQNVGSFSDEQEVYLSYHRELYRYE